MRSAIFPLILLVSLTACVPATPPPPSEYRAAYTMSRLPLMFSPGTVRAAPGYDIRLRDMRRVLPVQVVTTLRASGPLAMRRAEWVAHVLDRPVTLIGPAPGAPDDEAVLMISSPAIVADACRGIGERELGSIWPSNDDVPPRLLPPGCATEAAIQAQIVRPNDLLQGRPLPPTAATPFAAAIERYYRRNDPPQSNGGQSGGQGQSGSGSTSAEAQGAASNPLLGPVPSGGQAPAQ